MTSCMCVYKYQNCEDRVHFDTNNDAQQWLEYVPLMVTQMRISPNYYYKRNRFHYDVLPHTLLNVNIYRSSKVLYSLNNLPPSCLEILIESCPGTFANLPYYIKELNIGCAFIGRIKLHGNKIAYLGITSSVHPHQFMNYVAFSTFTNGWHAFRDQYASNYMSLYASHYMSAVHISFTISKFIKNDYLALNATAITYTNAMRTDEASCCLQLYNADNLPPTLQRLEMPMKLPHLPSKYRYVYVRENTSNIGCHKQHDLRNNCMNIEW
jgi:hypothetical protein